MLLCCPVDCVVQVLRVNCVAIWECGSRCCDIQSIWCGKWIIVSLEEANTRKICDSHRGNTDHWHIRSLISDWYDHVVVILLTLSHFCSRCYRCQKPSLLFSLCSSHCVYSDNIICLVSDVYSFAHCLGRIWPTELNYVHITNHTYINSRIQISQCDY